MNKQDLKNLIPLILLAMAIALSPSFSAGHLADGKIIEIRLEDILIAVLGFIWLGTLIVKKRKLERPPLLSPILIWLGIGLLACLTNLVLGNIDSLRSFFYFLKEVEFFFLFFYIYYHLKNIDLAKIITAVWIVLLVLNIGYVFYQIFFPPLAGDYGAAAIPEAGVFPTGAFFLISFIFLINLYLYYYLELDISNLKKGLLGILVLSPAFGVFSTGSKANLLGLVFVVVLSVIFLLFKKRNFKIILLILLILIIIAVFFGIGVKTVPRVKTMIEIFSPLKMVTEFKRARLVTSWSTLKTALDKEPAWLIYSIGMGKSYVSEAHNQYVRNFVETGIIGSLAFLFLIWFILKKSFLGFLKSQDSFSLGLSAGLLTATLTMLFIGLTAEVFIVIKPSEVYWFFTALTMATLYAKREY